MSARCCHFQIEKITRLPQKIWSRSTAWSPNPMRSQNVGRGYGEGDHLLHRADVTQRTPCDLDSKERQHER